MIKNLVFLCCIAALLTLSSQLKAQLLPPEDTVSTHTRWDISELSSPDAVFSEVQQRANAYFEAHPEMDSLNPLEKMAFKRWEYFWRNRANIDNASQPGKLTDVLNAMSNPSQLSFQQDLSTILIPSKWNLISPVEFETQNLGTVTAIWVNPANNNTILIGTETSGLWKTTDGGNNWVNITDSYAMANNAYITAAGFGVSSITVNQLNNNEIYIATFLPNTELELGHGANILKSTDGGVSWYPLSSFTAFISTNTGTYYKSMVWKIAYNYSQSNSLIFAAIGKQLMVFNATDGSTQYNPIFTLGVNSPNLTNPTEVYANYPTFQTITRKIRDFEFSNLLDGIICLTTDGVGLVPNVKAQAEVYYIQYNADNILTTPSFVWTRKDLPLISNNGFIDNAAVDFYRGVFYIAYDEKNLFGGNIAYFNIVTLNTIDNTFTNIFNHTHNFFECYPDFQVPTASIFNGFGYRYDAFKVTFNPLNKDILWFYVGGFDLTRIENIPSTNPVITPLTYRDQATAANNLQNENFNKNKYCHNGIRTLSSFYNGSVMPLLYIGNEGGISKYNSSDNNFTNINGKGLAITEFTNITTTHFNKRDVIVGGSIRNGLWHYEQNKNNNKWRQFYWEDGGNSLINDDNPENIFNCQYWWAAGFTSWVSSLFTKTITGLSYVGYSYINSSMVFTPSYVCPSLLSDDPQPPGLCGYVPPIEFHPTNTQTIYNGRHDVCESSNGGISFAAISGFTGDWMSNWSREIQAIKIAPSDPTVMYVAFADPTWRRDATYNGTNVTPGGKFFKGKKQTNNTWTWTDLTALVKTTVSPYPYTLGDVGVTDIAINPANADEIWITLNQFLSNAPSVGRERVIHTTNAGNNWTDYSQGLTPAPVNCIKYYNNNGDKLLFIGTDVGVFYRDPTDNSATATWQALNSATNPLPRCIVSDIEISYAANKLRVATLGRGIWETEIPCFTSLTSNDDKIVNQNETWQDDRTYASITINSGATLTIESTVKINGLNYITVNPGATLFLNGGTLAACPGQMWGGVKLRGYHMASQNDDIYHGKITIINNGTIKDALVGIEGKSIMYGGSVRGAGIIETYGSANFVNNQIAIKMNPYQNRYIGTNINIHNYSYLNNCNFTKDNTYHDPTNYPFTRFVELNGIDRINIFDCKFECDALNMPGFIGCGAEGIKSTNSVFTLIGSEFHNLGYGISATFANPAMQITVNKCTFDNNFYGALVMGTNNVWFTSNTFNVSNKIQTIYFPPYGTFTWELGWGLYLDGCQNGYNIEGNTFTKVNGTNVQEGNIGLLVNNSTSPVKTVYNNKFTNLKYGFLAQQDNGGNVGSTFGLKIKCNDFIACSNRDIAVTPLNALGISLAQGANITGLQSSPAGNIFTHLGTTGTPTDFDNTAGNTPIYYHHQGNANDPWVPKYYNNITPSPANGIVYEKKRSCPSISVVSGGGHNPHDFPLDPIAIHSKVTTAQLQFNSANLILQIWVDGGNTELLKQEVKMAYPWKAYELYNNLLGKSPYLSDEVLVEAIQNESVLPALMLKLILLANPQAIRSDRVMKALYNRKNSFPEEWIDELKQGLKVISPRNELEANVGYYAQECQQYFDLLKAYYLSDTTLTAHNSLVSLLATSGRVTDAYELAFTYFADDEVDLATDLMKNIPVAYNLQSKEDIKMFEQSQFYLNVLKNLRDAEYNYDKLNDDAKSWLKTATDNIEDDVYTANARALRLQYDTAYHYSEPVWLPEDGELKMTKPYNKTVAKPITTNNLSISPNPANDYTIISYTLETAPQNASIEIYDAMGKKMDIFPIVLAKEQKLINCNTYSKGMYHCILRNDGQIIASAKFNVVK